VAGRRALIIGGSLGGLFAAHFLRATGWQVTVFERTPGDLAGRGAGIGTQDALLAAMRRLGLPSDELGVPLDSCICLGRDGTIAEKIPYARVMSSWSRFYRPLRDALPDADYRAGVQLVEVDQDGTSVTARFADGTHATGDLLVAADGGRSTVRGLLLPEVEPEYAGYVGWRVVAEEQNLPPEMRPPLFDHYTFALPAGEMVLAYPVPARDGTIAVGQRGYNIVWYSPATPAQLTDFCTDATGRVHEAGIPPPLIRPEVLVWAKDKARALLAPQICAVIEHADQFFFQPIYDLSSSRLAFGRVVLLGDAAFIARPHVGAGVTKAALDAQALADAIAAETELDAALASYDRAQRRFGDWIVAASRRLGAHIGGPAIKPVDVMRLHIATNSELRARTIPG
jgi:2-polyprenyl-6-methoxyphenol hydroxylase-like FAD-dependent oxidoreductase